MMQSDKRGGRSSATRSEGAPTPRGAAGSQNSPPPFALPETAQEKAGAFSKRRSRISVDNYFSHFVHAAPKPLLANNEAARLIIEPWRAANFWRVGRYVIMPNYIHLFCAPNTVPAQPLKS